MTAMSWRARLVNRLSSEPFYWLAIAVLLALVVWNQLLYRRALQYVYYAPDADRLQVARGEAFAIPDQQIARFAEHFTSNFEAFLPSTVEAQMGYVRTLMSERALAQDPNALADVARYSRSGAITSLVQIIPGTTEVREGRNRWVVTFEILKQEYTREHLWRARHLRCTVVVVPGPIGPVHPDGLLIDGYSFEAAEPEETPPGRRQ